MTRAGVDVQAALGTGGLTNSPGTTVHLLWTLGDDTAELDDYALATTTTTNIKLKHLTTV